MVGVVHAVKPALGKPRQKDHEFKATLEHIMRLSKKKRTRRKEKVMVTAKLLGLLYYLHPDVLDLTLQSPHYFYNFCNLILHRC